MKEEKVAGMKDAGEEKETARGYVAKFGQTLVEAAKEDGGDPVILQKGDRVRVPAWLKEAVAWEEDETGILIRIPEVTERTTPTRTIEKRVDVDLGLTSGDVEYLRALVKKQKFGIEEPFSFKKARDIDAKLAGFENLPLIPPEEPDEDDEEEDDT